MLQLEKKIWALPQKTIKQYFAHTLSCTHSVCTHKKRICTTRIIIFAHTQWYRGLIRSYFFKTLSFGDVAGLKTGFLAVHGIQSYTFSDFTMLRSWLIFFLNLVPCLDFRLWHDGFNLLWLWRRAHAHHTSFPLVRSSSFHSDLSPEKCLFLP